MAICKVFRGYCKENKIDLHRRNFSLFYDTDIPRQTGLSGSSAIVCAALNCPLDFYNVRHLVKVKVRPNLVLNAEKQLVIVAGLQARVAQDFTGGNMEKLGHGIYNLLPLFLIYAKNPSDSGKVGYHVLVLHVMVSDVILMTALLKQVHSTVRQRWLKGDKFIISDMEEVANLALEGLKALLEMDCSKFAKLMHRNFDLRMC